jgi:hypothetical protein
MFSFSKHYKIPHSPISQLREASWIYDIQVSYAYKLSKSNFWAERAPFIFLGKPSEQTLVP